MANSGRTRVTLACTECGDRNYTTTKNKKLPETPALYPAPRSTLSAGTEPLCGKKAAQRLLFYAMI